MFAAFMLGPYLDVKQHWCKTNFGQFPSPAAGVVFVSVSLSGPLSPGVAIYDLVNGIN
jgi:hypothetical protein